MATIVLLVLLLLVQFLVIYITQLPKRLTKEQLQQNKLYKIIKGWYS